MEAVLLTSAGGKFENPNSFTRFTVTSNKVEFVRTHGMLVSARKTIHTSPCDRHAGMVVHWLAWHFLWDVYKYVNFPLEIF